MKRELLLIQPPQRGLLNGFANGLIDLANFVAQSEPGARISIHDLGLTPSASLAGAAREALSGHDTDVVVGITTTTASYRAALATARAFKAVNPGCLTVLGGHHASPQHEVVLRTHHSIVDAVVRGEGERSLLALVQGQPLANVPGLSGLRRGQVYANPAASLLQQHELDSLPITFEGSSFASAPGKFDHATYVSARGCPLRCAFCAVAGEPTRAKSVGRVQEDLRYLVANCGYQRIAIEDNFFAQNRGRVLAICDALIELQQQLGVRFTWDCQTRVESMRAPEMLSALERAGCEAVYLGVESLLEEELVYLGKTSQPGSYLKSLVEVADRIVASAVGCYINLQIALPGESAAHRQARRQRLADLGRLAARRGKTLTVFPQLHVVYPGTHHFWKSVEQRLFGGLGHEVFEPFTEWEEAEEPVLQFLGENFAHGVGGIPLGILVTDRLRIGEFEVSDTEVAHVRRHLKELEELDGITLFKYGSYLTGENPQDPDAPLQDGGTA